MGAQYPYSYWTNWFSEETTTATICAGGFVAGIKCRGSYCDDLAFLCVYNTGTAWAPKDCRWIPNSLFSEEQGLKYFDDQGEDLYLAGARCSGSYCDNLSLYVCKR